MRKITNKLMKSTFLALVMSLMMYNSVFAVSTGHVQVGSGNKSGIVYGWNSVAGNATTGYYAEGDTGFTSGGIDCSGIIAGVQMTVKSGSKTMYTGQKSVPSINSMGTQVWASLHSGFFLQII